MKQKVIRIDARDIEDLADRKRQTPAKFMKRKGAMGDKNAKAALHVDFVKLILSRLNDLSLPYLTGKAVRFELWIDEDERNHKNEPRLYLKFFTPPPWPSIKRGLVSFEYPIN